MDLKISDRIKRNKILRVILFPVIAVRRQYSLIRGKIITLFFDYLVQPIAGGSVFASVPWFDGIFLFNIKSPTLKRILIYKIYENGLSKIIRALAKEGSDIIDVGANIGMHTVLCAKSIPPRNRVLAVEPIPSALNYLEANVASNKVQGKVIIYRGAAADKRKKKIIMNYAAGYEEYSRIGSTVHPIIRDQKTQEISVSCETVDSLVKKYHLKPSLIKIDVEGADYLVIKGAQQTIRQFRPAIICEFVKETQADYNVTGESILNFLKERDYSITFVEKEIVLARPRELDKD
jgi:FkbM family methyltransferase